jgi:hypothetical protein
VPSFDAELVRLTAAEFAHLGNAATYVPASGPTVACKVTLQGPDALAQLGDAGLNLPDVTLRVAVAALPARPQKGERFEVGAERFYVLDVPRLREDDRQVWTIDVERRAS